MPIQFTVAREQNHCPKCKQAYDEPQLIKYYVCPNCHAKIEEEQKTGCQYWFGYLNSRDKSDQIPQDCVECAKAIECMLSQDNTSPAAIAHIKEWY
jgi:hypothetical protein